jgi:hypothetical protein
VSEPIDPNASPEMQPICSTDSPLPQPLNEETLLLAVFATAINFTKKADEMASEDPYGAAVLLDSAVGVLNSIS